MTFISPYPDASETEIEIMNLSPQSDLDNLESLITPSAEHSNAYYYLLFLYIGIGVITCCCVSFCSCVMLKYYYDKCNGYLPNIHGPTVPTWRRKYVCSIEIDKDLKKEIQEFRRKHRMDMRHINYANASKYCELKGRFNPSLTPKVLKYCKQRDPNRVLSRKWSAYSKLVAC